LRAGLHRRRTSRRTGAGAVRDPCARASVPAAGRLTPRHPIRIFSRVLYARGYLRPLIMRRCCASAKRRRRSVMKGFRLAIILGLSLLGTAPLGATDDRDNDKPYLALGDSVAFGFMPMPGFEAVNASNFVGFPDFVGRALRRTRITAACPGEASGSFLDTAAEDSGCRDYRAQAPLPAAYTGTQGAVAIQCVKANRNTRLVTMQLGANDLFQLRDRCFGEPSCIATILPFTLAILEQNILTTIADLRAAGYRRPIVLVNYFPLDLRDTQTTALIQALNAAIADAAVRGGAGVADRLTECALVR